MKELSNEDKAKRYDEAIERAKKWYDANTNEGYRGIFEEIFPELKESEDERIRKDILDFIRREGQHIDKLKWHKWIAWLKKQAEQNLPIEKLPFEMKTVSESLGFTTQKECDDYNKMVTDLIMSDGGKGEQKPAWSEEDERYIGGIVSDLEYLKDTANAKALKERFQDKIDWLKSLRPQNRWISVDKEVYIKEPVLAQKKDKSDLFKGYVVCCDHTLDPFIYERYISLDNCSQFTWKPSDEQMNNK